MRQTRFSTYLWPIFTLVQLAAILGLLFLPIWIYILLSGDEAMGIFDIIPALFLAAGWITMIHFLYYGWFQGLVVVVFDDRLCVQNWALNRRCCLFDSVEAIKLISKNGGLRVEIIEHSGRIPARYVADTIENFGRLCEMILQRLPANTQVMGFSPEAIQNENFASSWQKEPDWDIINAAIARAEENRKKKEQQEQKL